ncbi:hypothetical protein A2Z33_02055 [Candidatus Gottesmanbacteria bacterium RBG_16_52_11]|uniref:Uncharacterized protein n=1 Tax=Candidatus Gottesmanbacteria bacterium RBG_16_52_11 TaxID=1798374 RepID=A0A1F5YR57_9BACT|nr:MAG: hypothetical protein A2Z33_02055 [Candidatus Gottesmanbacteria bacterium RBG_16_52_11]
MERIKPPGSLLQSKPLIRVMSDVSELDPGEVFIFTDLPHHHAVSPQITINTMDCIGRTGNRVGNAVEYVKIDDPRLHLESYVEDGYFPMCEFCDHSDSGGCIIFNEAVRQAKALAAAE